MSRPIKQGLDYFPLDVDMDEKTELIEAKHGITGFGVMIKLFQKIYKEGYYIKWNEDSLLLFSKRINVDKNLVNDIIKDCFQYNLLDETSFNTQNILTSHGIQKRYLNAVDRRKTVELNKKYVIVNINEVNVNINWINDDNSTQSKVKESKVKESTKILPPKSADDFIDQIINIFVEEYGDYKILNPGKERAAAGKILNHYKKEFPDSNSEETLKSLRIFFKECVNINDNWLYTNMSLPIIVSKFNEIVKVLKNGKTKFKGTTNEGLFRSIAKNFADDYGLSGKEYD